MVRTAAATPILTGVGHHFCLFVSTQYRESLGIHDFPAK